MRHIIMSNNNPGPIPKRWLNCPSLSHSFITDKFLAFKTPLAEKFKDQVPIKNQFLPKMVFEFVKTSKMRLGLWIDLTNTKRFYDKKEIESTGSEYIKLKCRGHDGAPSPEQTKSFIDIVDNFIAKHPLEIIGVHCTHGFNRTGFLIVSYMVEKMDCAVDAALMAFSQARPNGIYKADYIKELFKRYENEEDAPPPPEQPAWCLEFEEEEDDTRHATKHQLEQSEEIVENNEENDCDDDEDDDDDDEDETNEGEGPQKERKNGESSQPARKKRRLKQSNFMVGVPGVQLVTKLTIRNEIRKKCKSLCHWSAKGFPGSQPVSMDPDNLMLLQKKPYQVSWKADGTRYMMLINKKNEIYFIDRDFSVFQVSHLKFPRCDSQTEHIENTLLDGEMVIDIENGVSTPRYYVYDIIGYQDEDVGKKPFCPHRLRSIRDYIIAPRYNAMNNGLIIRAKEPFSVRQKNFYDVKNAGYLISPQFLAGLHHKPDGLIFQPTIDPYMAGCCPDVLKWKPSYLNSIDFLLRISTEEGIGIVKKKIGYLFVGGTEKHFDTMHYTSALKNYDGKIIECKFENNKWVFMRERTDKSFPNSYTTAIAVLKSILRPVTTNYLLEFIHKRRYRDDAVKMPPPPPPQKPQ